MIRELSLRGLVREMVGHVHPASAGPEVVDKVVLLGPGRSVAVVPPDAVSRYEPLGLRPLESLPAEQLRVAATELLTCLEETPPPEPGVGLAHLRQLQEIYPDIQEALLAFERVAQRVADGEPGEQALASEMQRQMGNARGSRVRETDRDIQIGSTTLRKRGR